MITTNHFSQAKILIVCGQDYNDALLERILSRAGYTQIHHTIHDSDLEWMLSEVEPDIVLVHMHKREMDSLQALALIREHTVDNAFLPVLMLMEAPSPTLRQHGLQAGVNDFLIKPYDRMEVVLRINNLLKTRSYHIQLKLQNSSLEERVRERTEDLKKAKRETLKLLGRIGEYRDDMTGSHTQRVGKLARRLAEKIGLSHDHADMIAIAAPLHDIGKIGIADTILLKPGRFEAHEFEQMKEHTVIGARMLEGSSFTVLKLAQIIAKSHHEKWDGSGYPEGLSEKQIPIEARIVALADFYDALTHERPYKKAWSTEETLEEILRQRGKHFDPDVVDAFIIMMTEET
jgi:putative two-component system response regulator